MIQTKKLDQVLHFLFVQTMHDIVKESFLRASPVQSTRPLRDRSFTPAKLLGFGSPQGPAILRDTQLCHPSPGKVRTDSEPGDNHGHITAKPLIPPVSAINSPAHREGSTAPGGRRRWDIRTGIGVQRSQTGTNSNFGGVLHRPCGNRWL